METTNEKVTEELTQVIEATEGTSTLGKVIVGVFAGIGVACTFVGAIFGAKKGYDAIQNKKAYSNLDDEEEESEE